MQWKLRCLVLALLWLAAHIACGQQAPGPAILPPPLPSDEAEAASVPQPAPIFSDETLPLPGEASATTGAEINLPPDAVTVEDSTWYQPMYWFGPAPWDTGIELGINGSSGTSESLSLRTGGYIKRESRFSKLDLSTYYNRTTENGNATQNNAQFEVRNDWLLDENSPWTLYATGDVFYDEFQAFDLQTSANTGVGYRFVHEPGLELMSRFGAGTSREASGTWR